MQASHSGLNLTNQAEPGYGQLLGTLWRQRFWLTGVFILCVAAAYFYTQRQKPTYVSGMQLLVEANYQSKKTQSIDLESAFADSKIEVDAATQINLMQSSGLLQKAMAIVQNDYPELNPAFPANVAKFKGSISVGQAANSNKKEPVTKIFQVTYTDTDPVKTQAVLKALQTVYLDYNLEQQRLRLARGLSFVNQQLPQVQRKLSQSETALEEFRRNQEVIDPDLQAKTQAESLNRVITEQKTNAVQLQELQSRYTNLLQQLALSPRQAVIASRLTQSERYQELLNQIQKTELALLQQRVRFKDNTAYVQQIEDQRQRQLGLLQEQVKRVLGSDAAQPGSGEQLLFERQLTTLELNLVNQLIETQVNLRVAEARAQSLTQIKEQLRAELKQFPALLAQYGRLIPEVELNRDSLKQLLKAKQDIGQEIARGGFDWQIVEEPQLGYKTGPNLTTNLMLGGVVGLLLGGAAAFARSAADDSVHSSDDLVKQTPVPLLGVVPALALETEERQSPIALPFFKPSTGAADMGQVIHWRPFRESLDLLYQNVQLLNGAAPLESLVVTSALAGEGKSTLVLGLAISAARLHKRVLLVDADLRRPSLHKLLSLPNEQGLSTLLTSDAPIPMQIATQDSNLRSNISVVTAGPTPADPAKLLSSHRMQEAMAIFEQHYDLVLIDAPPVLGMVDAMLAASRCKGVLMVGRIDRVTHSEFTQALKMLNKLNVIGVVANGVNSQLRANQDY
jgi:polysaccharide biosynthesis transport protein